METTEKYLVCIGGGEIKDKTTLKIDEYVVGLAKKRAGAKRPRALFIGTASHDFMPYFNSFRKTYTGVLDVKVDCLLTVYTTYGADKMKEKFDLCDVIYVGGGDTVFMLEKWRESGVIDLIKDAYERGVIIAGLSAGAICWFEDMYTDSIKTEVTGEYCFFKGLGLIKSACSPHYDERREDLKEALTESKIPSCYAIDGNAALVFVNGEPIGSVSSGGKAYILRNNAGVIEEYEIQSITE